MLYQVMRKQGVGKAELASRLGWYLPQVDRVLNVQHQSGLEHMDAVLGAIGRRLHLTAAVVEDPAGLGAGQETTGQD